MADSLLEHITRWDLEFQQRHPARIRAGQKEAFLAAAAGELEARGFRPRRLQTRSLLKNRLLVTYPPPDPSQASGPAPKVIFTAHYDTPTMMPFWVSWVYRLFGHTRQVSGTIFLLALLFLPDILQPFFPTFDPLFDIVRLVLLLSFLVLLIPNPRNREDNTSGVIGLLALAEWLGERPDLREQVQLALLDNEEWGLLGSMGLRRIWDADGHPYRQALVINLDCISRGSIPLLVHHGNDDLARRLLPFVRQHFPQARSFNMGPIPLSDNFTFRDQASVDISLAEPSTIPGGYFIPRIHSPRDDDFNPQRTRAVVASLAAFLEAELTAPGSSAGT